MTKVYLIDQYDRWCPENNDGDYFIAAFSTMELAENYVRKAKVIEGKGGCNGFSIREFSLDTEEPVDYNVVDEDWTEEDTTEFLKALEEVKDEL